MKCLKKKKKIFKSCQVCDWLAKWIIMLRFMDLRWPRVFRRSSVGLVYSSKTCMFWCYTDLFTGLLWYTKAINLIHLTHWGWVTHICISKLTITGSDNGLSPGRHQAIIWTNDGILLIRPLGTNVSEILIKNHMFSLQKMYWKMLYGKWRPFCLGLNVSSKIFNV